MTTEDNEYFKKIETLRSFFKISNAAFNFAEIVYAIGPNKMQELHKMAMTELAKDKPDLFIIDDLLLQMEEQANKNKHKLNFPKGGF
jgi:hypothetical protein